jgi:membrane-bound ClpP family serine protease
MILTGGKNMSWIKDVKEELKALDISKKSLRNFGLLVGQVFLLLGFWIYYSSQSVIGIIFFVVGALLFIFGLLLPNFLSGVYKVWMGLAFALGWIMSRVLLIILFYGVITSISFIARIFGKKFMDLKFKDGKDSYWVKKPDAKIDYSKMY